jgi:demethylmenaquinone methyltransferase / 2-methoxy-6-polyprenyl-1,4-benzoquinol methylase
MSDAPVLNAAKLDTDADDVFGRIAERYDLLCDIFSVLSHRRWKQRLAEEIVKTDGVTFVDVASGTGHIVHRVMKLLADRPGAQRKSILATDLSDKMLAVARRKDAGHYKDIIYAVSSAYHLKDVATSSVDVLSISFAMKITDRLQVMREAARVLKPGGTFFCLEAARIPVGFVHRAYLTYMNLCLPFMALIATGGDRSAYDYLLRGIHNFPDQRKLCAEIEAFGFRDVSYANISLGIVALHRGTRV